jgi:hypothetical protein
MKYILTAFLLSFVACAHTATPLPAGEWAYRYDNGALAYYDGAAWAYGVGHDQKPPVRRAPVLGAAAPSTYQWVAPLTAASYGVLATQGGTVYEAHCTVKTISASETLYVFFIDTLSGAQPTNGTAAINGGVSGGMTAAGNDVTWSDQTNPVLTFVNGIMFAASLTPDTYTAPNAADVLRCDAKLRSTTP